MAVEGQKRRPDSPRLFGTLLATKPGGTRSPTSLALAVLVHIVAIGLLILLTRPFIPTLAHKLFEQITIVVPEDEPQIISMPQTAAPVEPASSRDRDRDRDRTGAEEVILTPGPVVGIPEATPGPETVEPADDGGGRGGSLADRLRPTTIDPRLSGSARYTLPPDASPAAAVRARIAQSLGAYHDSVAAEAEARRRAFDWTIKTKDGKRWGINPDGTIQLGDIKLPQVAFKAPDGRRDEINARNRDFAEIERQASSEIGRQSFNQRVKAIRARKEKEREEKKKAAEAAPISER
ncbi:MAG: hypothetical protein ACT4O1_03825 [Gemmatimonadota bacterium]